MLKFLSLLSKEERAQALDAECRESAARVSRVVIWTGLKRLSLLLEMKSDVNPSASSLKTKHKKKFLACLLKRENKDKNSITIL